MPQTQAHIYKKAFLAPGYCDAPIAYGCTSMSFTGPDLSLIWIFEDGSVLRETRTGKLRAFRPKVVGA